MGKPFDGLHAPSPAALALSHANDVARLRFLHGAPSPDGRTPLPFGLVVLRGGAAD